MTGRLISLSVLQKQAIICVIDTVLALVTLWIAFSLRFSAIFMFFDWRQGVVFALAAVLVPPIFIRCGLYRAVFRYSSFGAASAVVRAVAVYGVIFALCVLALSFPNVPRTVTVIQPVLFAWAVLAVRSFGAMLLSRYGDSNGDRNVERVLIYGAGVSGIQTLSALRFGRAMRVTAFIDEDDRKIGREVFGVHVLSRAKAEIRLLRGEIDSVLLALPNVSRARRNEIIEWLRPFKVHVRTIPSVRELAAGNMEMSIKELEVEDLLGRAPVETTSELLKNNVFNRTVLITGAGGSIGSELCRQVLTLLPAKLILFDLSEYALYSIHRELEDINKTTGNRTLLVPLLGSVRDVKRVDDVLLTWSPNVVYHAAAYKHVPLVEGNPFEGVANNVLGTAIVARSAMAVGVDRFVLVSTDKAVRPTNVMGASKRMAEIVLQGLAGPDVDGTTGRSNTIFTMVRFGNVLGSSGSVVPLFRAQIANGLPVTVTHREITRYFMSIPEAAQLVLQAGAMAKGGEVFLLDMGDPIRIVDLARRMIELSGAKVRDEATPDGDIEILFTGLRPGEKLYEELLIGENDFPTEHDRIIQARERMWQWPEVCQALTMLEEAIAANDLGVLRGVMSRYVDGFQAEPAAAVPLSDHLLSVG